MIEQMECKIRGKNKNNTKQSQCIDKMFSNDHSYLSVGRKSLGSKYL